MDGYRRHNPSPIHQGRFLIVDLRNTPTKVILVGAGVVGRAIMRAHVDAGVSVWIANIHEAALASAVQELRLSADSWTVSDVKFLAANLPAVELRARHAIESSDVPLVIESIQEKLDVKQSFFQEAEQVFGDDAILCSNTSTLRISRIAEPLVDPSRFCGMHFFMPVYNRSAVEIIGGDSTSKKTLDLASKHVRRLNKSPLVVGDSPGFVVNRLLSPYLNEAMLMLCRGNRGETIEHAALEYGMPLSPLELIDWIGTGTMFDAGRAFWQAFPNRLDPAPMLVAMVKKKRAGRARGTGFYDYENGQRSSELAPETQELSKNYQRVELLVSEEEIKRVLSILMWIEAAIAHREGIVSSHLEFDLAMQGGLGYDPQRSWLEFFDELGSECLLDTISRWSEVTKAMNAPPELRDLLSQMTPTQALIRYAEVDLADRDASTSTQ